MLTSKPKFVLFCTTQRSELSAQDNAVRLAQLAQVLDNHVYSFELVAGLYEGQSEQSVAVYCHSLEQAQNLTWYLNKVWQQECTALLETATMELFLLYAHTPTLDRLGQFQPIKLTENVVAATYWRGQWWAA